MSTPPERARFLARDSFIELDAELVRRNASPGGCADLLAACLFLDDATRENQHSWNA